MAQTVIPKAWPTGCPLETPKLVPNNAPSPALSQSYRAATLSTAAMTSKSAPRPRSARSDARASESRASSSDPGGGPLGAARASTARRRARRVEATRGREPALAGALAIPRGGGDEATTRAEEARAEARGREAGADAGIEAEASIAGDERVRERRRARPWLCDGANPTKRRKKRIAALKPDALIGAESRIVSARNRERADTAEPRNDRLKRKRERAGFGPNARGEDLKMHCWPKTRNDHNDAFTPTNVSPRFDVSHRQICANVSPPPPETPSRPASAMPAQDPVRPRPRARASLALAALSLLASLASVAAQAETWTPARFEASVLAPESARISARPHLVWLFAPWCGHCRQMAPEYDKVAAALAATHVVLKVDCADAESGGPAFCETIGVAAYPAVRLFRDGRAFEFAGSDRSARAVKAFATRASAATHASRGYHALEREDGTRALAMAPKGAFDRYADGAREIIMEVARDVRKCVRETPVGAVVIFFVAFFLALIGLVLTELFCDAFGVPRRGESWEDLRLRSEWEAKRREELAKEKEGKTE